MSMKLTISVIPILMLFACGGTSAKIETWNSNVAKKGQQNQKQVADLLIGTWYVNEILINGQPDLEDFPTNNDELILNEDGTFVSIDKTFDMEDKGTWERLDERRFAVTTEGEKVVFEILNLTISEMSTRMVSNEIDMVINYSKSK